MNSALGGLALPGKMALCVDLWCPEKVASICVHIRESGYCLMLIVLFKYSTLAPGTMVLGVLSDFSSVLLFGWRITNNLYVID